MKGQSPVHKKIILAIGYKYNSRKVLCFVASENAGNTLAGEPYRARFKDNNSNLVSRPVDRPHLISTYFLRSNAVDKHNHVRQFELRLEKHWLTMNCWFRIFSTILGITVADSWKAYCYGMKNKTTTICEFADMLAFELMHNSFGKEYQEERELVSPLRRSPRLRHDCSADQDITNNQQLIPRELELPETGESDCISPVTESRASLNSELLWNHYKKMHVFQKEIERTGDGRAKRGICKECSRQSSWFCRYCMFHVCADNQGNRKDCCYSDHIMKKHPNCGLSLPNTR
jgi:hypothetical protein